MYAMKVFNLFFNLHNDRTHFVRYDMSLVAWCATCIARAVINGYAIF